MRHAETNSELPSLILLDWLGSCCVSDACTTYNTSLAAQLSGVCDWWI